jgi:hypothetical protein
LGSAKGILSCPIRFFKPSISCQIDTNVSAGFPEGLDQDWAPGVWLNLLKKFGIIIHDQQSPVNFLLIAMLGTPVDKMAWTKLKLTYIKGGVSRDWI